MAICENKCLKCGHIWLPRKKIRSPRCPKCNTAYWDYKFNKDKKDK